MMRAERGLRFDTPRMRFLDLAALLVLVATFPACDAGEDAPGTPGDSIGGLDSTAAAADSTIATAPAPATDGCRLIDEVALERAVGFDVVMNDNRTGNCVATPASGDAAATTVDFRVEPRLAAYDYFAAQSDATPVAGLGERAVWATLNETTGYVVAVRNDHSFVVGVGEADGVDAQSRALAEAVARLLLEAEMGDGI